MSTTHPITRLTTVITTGLLRLVIVSVQAGRRLREQIRTRMMAARIEPDAGYSSETVVVTSLLVGVAVVVFGTIFWDDITSYAKTIFSDITHS